MDKKNICILYGGKSGEHEVSMLSAASVISHLDRGLYEITAVGISKAGRWYLQPEATADVDAGRDLSITADENLLAYIAPGAGLFCEGRKLDIDFVFPVLHGTFGEDGTVQGLLELADLPYAGSGVSGSSIGMDKEIIKKIWMAAGLDTVPCRSLNIDLYSGSDFSLTDFASELENEYGYPLFIKPARAGSSVGISKADDYTEFSDAVIKAFKFDSRIIFEPAVDAREIECSVIGNFTAEAYLPGEIAPTHEFYDYEAKYIDENGAALIIPADIPEELIERVKDTAVRAYLEAGIEGMARVDFFIDRKTGKLLLNEVNTIPGFTSISMFSKMCEAGGLPYSNMLDKLIALGEERFNSRNKLSFTLAEEAETV